MVKIKNLYFFLVVLYSGMALAFFRSQEGLIALWILGLFVFWKETIKPHKMLFVALAVWMGYFTINTLIIRSFHPLFMGIYIAKIMIAYWLITYYKENLFLKYEDTIYILVIVSLFFYAIHCIVPDAVMFNFFQKIDLSENLFPRKSYASIGIYTFNQRDLSEFFPRNAGFCWEPGPFSCYIILALFINIVRNGTSLQDKKRLIVYFLGIITTQSSTGFMILIAIIIWYAWTSHKSILFRFFSIPIAISLVIIILTNVPWLQEKIIKESEQDIEEVLQLASTTSGSYAPGRFASFQLRWKDFKNYPIAGFGGNSSLQTGYLGKDNVVAAINGIGKIMGQYGIIGFLLFLLLIYKTGKWLGCFYNYSSHIIFPIIIIMIGFGFGIIESPMIVSLWMFPIFSNYKK